MTNASSAVEADLDYIASQLQQEFVSMAGCHLLITGGAGFLGYYLVQAVLHWNEKHANGSPIRVTVYDNFMRGRPRWLSDLERNPNLTVRVHDMTKPLPADIEEFQYIIHAASIASPHYYRKFPIETMDANINGLRALLDYIRATIDAGKPFHGFMFYSTSEIYGDPTPENVPTSEEYRGNVSCTGPRACYDESKRYGETLCVNYSQQYDLPIKISRPFNNYGPGLKIGDKRVIPDFARDVFSGRDITMFSDGSPTRTYCYVADAVIGHYKVLVRGRNGEPYNIGIDRPEISVAQLADLLVSHARSLFGYKGSVVYKTSDDKEYLVDNPNRRCPNIDKARRDLDYAPQVLVDDGLRRALIWYSENQDSE
jgi:UDP-glucuronate decarboxylase